MRESILHRKERLIITAIEVIDELGIQGLSTREIARRQDVSEATLFRHYKNKNELLLGVLDHFSKFDNEILQSAKLKNLSAEEAIVYFITSTVEYYENYPAITSIMQIFDVLRYDNELSDKVKQILDNQTSIIKSLIEEAQNEGQICSEADSTDLAFLIMGFCREICLKWRISRQAFSLSKKTLSTLEMTLKAFKDKKR
ncbi:MAG: TetR/AcrR family transcriptional regulator [Clostridiaceae bacterium]|jgi:AcrR family transcriptional regulator|nr:TetR/AcrR family transcriptional regulator [Clostridiaceae bacterium]